MTEDETVIFSAVGVERVLGRGELIGLAIVELTLHDVAAALQGIKIRRFAGDRITVTLPDFHYPQTDRMCTAIILPRELSDAIGTTVARAYEMLVLPTLSPDPSRGVPGLQRYLNTHNRAKSDYARNGK